MTVLLGMLPLGVVPLGMLLAATLAAAPAGPVEEDNRAVRVIDVDHLKIQITDVAVLDIRAKDIYLKGHVPPAHPLDVDELARAVLSAPEPPANTVMDLLARVPVQAHRPLVIYDNRGPGRRDGTTAWLLAYAGLPNVHILDGGFAAWSARGSRGVFMGYPMPSSGSALRASDLRPRPELRVSPDDLAGGTPAGAAVLEVLPANRAPEAAEPGPGQVRLDELMDEREQFLFPYHLQQLLAAREVDAKARLLLRGPLDVAALAWAVFTANGFDAALVLPVRETSGEKSPS